MEPYHVSDITVMRDTCVCVFLRICFMSACRTHIGVAMSMQHGKN